MPASTSSDTYIMQVSDLLEMLNTKDSHARVVVADCNGDHLPVDGVRVNGTKGVIEITTTYRASECERIEDLEDQLVSASNLIRELKKQIEELEGK